MVTSWRKNYQRTAYVLIWKTIQRKGNGSTIFIKGFKRNQNWSKLKSCDCKIVLRQKDSPSILFTWTYCYSQLLFLDIKIASWAWLSSIWNCALGHFMSSHCESWWIWYVSRSSQLRYWTWQRFESLITIKKRNWILSPYWISLFLCLFKKTHSARITLIPRVAQNRFSKSISCRSFFWGYYSYEGRSFRQKNWRLFDFWSLVLCLCLGNLWRLFKARYSSYHS